MLGVAVEEGVLFRLPVEPLELIGVAGLAVGADHPFEVAIELEGVSFTPIPVDHLVPTHGFLLRQGSSAVLWSSDTGPTSRLWEIANRTPNLKAVCIDTSFDNALQQVADVSLHLTPQTLERELRKLDKRIPVLVHHLKPPCVAKIKEEVKLLRNPDIEFLEQGKEYKF